MWVHYIDVSAQQRCECTILTKINVKSWTSHDCLWQQIMCPWQYFRLIIITWAVTWQNQQSDCVPSEDSDQPGHPPLSAWRKLWSLSTHWAHSEDSDQTGRMLRLICLHWAHTQFLGFVMSQLTCLQIMLWEKTRDKYIKVHICKHLYISGIWNSYI